MLLKQTILKNVLMFVIPTHDITANHYGKCIKYIHFYNIILLYP